MHMESDILEQYLAHDEQTFRVMVLDDQRTLRALLGRAFARVGFAYLITDSWAEASKALSQRPPHAFVLDLNMPALPGERLGPILRRYLPPGTPILIYSGEPEERRRHALSEIGADKAFHKSEVSQLVDALLGLQQACQG